MLSFLGDLASVFGLLITVVGFGVTIWTVSETRKRVEEGLARIRSQVILNEVNHVLQIVRALDVACRDRVWVSAIERADEARSHLARLAESPRLTTAEQALFRGVPGHLAELLAAVQKLRRERNSKDLDKKHTNRLHRLITALSTAIGRLQEQALEYRDGHRP